MLHLSELKCTNNRWGPESRIQNYFENFWTHTARPKKTMKWKCRNGNSNTFSPICSRSNRAQRVFVVLFVFVWNSSPIHSRLTMSCLANGLRIQMVEQDRKVFVQIFVLKRTAVGKSKRRKGTSSTATAANAVCRMWKVENHSNREREEENESERETERERYFAWEIISQAKFAPHGYCAKIHLRYTLFHIQY